jgi:hypothetical protein
MRVRLDGGKVVVKLLHFRYCSKHIALLMQLQLEVPNMVLFTESPSWNPFMVPLHKLDLDHEELRFLNPSEAA